MAKIPFQEVSKSIVDLVESLIRDSEHLSKFKQDELFKRELLFFKYFATDASLHMVNIDESVKVKLRKGCATEWERNCPKEYEHFFFENLDDRTMEYAMVAQKGADGLHTRIGFLFAKLCNSTNLELSLMIGALFQTIFEAVVKFIGRVNKEYKVM